MNNTDIIGKFEVYESFSIKNRKQFYLFGNLIEGKMGINDYVLIKLNSSLKLSRRINGVESVEFSSSNEKFTLIIFDCEEDDELNLLDFFRIGHEYVHISSTGED
jgi:hypothetical protein